MTVTKGHENILESNAPLEVPSAVTWHSSHGCVWRGLSMNVFSPLPAYVAADVPLPFPTNRPSSTKFSLQQTKQVNFGVDIKISNTNYLNRQFFSTIFSFWKLFGSRTNDCRFNLFISAIMYDTNMYRCSCRDAELLGTLLPILTQN